MIVRALNAQGDWTFGAGKNNYLQANAAVGQTILCRLGMFLGDCFFATNQGIDWFNLLGGKNLLQLELAISAVILNTKNVTGLVTLSTDLDSITRNFSASYEVTTTFGNVKGVVNQTLEIGPVAPPVNNLLPQFNQPLLNNSGPNAVFNAVFNSTAFWRVDLGYTIERRTTTQNFVQAGTLVLMFNISTGQWGLTDNISSGSSGPDFGVTFTIDQDSGQVFYTADDMTGDDYVGNLIVQSTETYTAGK